MTLEELKKLSPEKLGCVWWSGQFPFENIPSCGVCLTNHSSPRSTCKVESHRALKAALPCRIYSEDDLINHLDELYALRLFFKDLYPFTPEVEQPEEVSREFART